MYLQCPSKESRTAIIVFYVLCLLYVLSMVTFASDLLGSVYVLEVSNNSTCNIIIMQMRIGALSPQLQFGSQSLPFRFDIIQVISNGSCDFIAQCILVRINHWHRTYHPFCSPKSSKIYRCWIVWDRNIRFVILPSLMAIAYIGQSLNLSSSDKQISESIYRL